MATIEISREHRDAIYEEIESLSFLGDDLPLYLKSAPMSEGDRRWVCEYAQTLVMITRLLEALGWEENGTQESYVLDVDEDVARFMAQMEQNALGGLQDNSGDLDDERATAARYGQTYTEDEWAARCAELRARQDGYLDGLDVARRAQAAYRHAVA